MNKQELKQLIYKGEFRNMEKDQQNQQKNQQNQQKDQQKCKRRFYLKGRNR